MTTMPMNAAPSDQSAKAVLVTELHRAHNRAVGLLLEIIRDCQDDVTRGIALLDAGKAAEGRSVLNALVLRMDRFPPSPIGKIERARNAGVWEDWPATSV